MRDKHTKEKRHRFQFKFWLDANKDSELLLCEELDHLKAKRQFAPTIRNALRLFFDLSKGNTDVLTELFPGIVAKLQTPAETPANTEFAAILDRVVAVQEQLSRSTPGALPALPVSIENSSLPSIFTTEKIEISSKEVRENFTSAMGDLFGDDNEDDIWD